MRLQFASTGLACLVLLALPAAWAQAANACDLNQDGRQQAQAVIPTP
jgi:hypothetical protein